MSTDDTASSNPFPGLRPFRIEEDYLFFGREAQTTELLKLLREHRFLAVVGTSGSGKSSLVRAGLIPALHRGTMTRAGSSWEVVVQRPGGDPLRNLAEALCGADLYDAEDAETVPRLVATLRNSTRGLIEAYRQSDIETGTNLLIVVDQFEELFRFRQSEPESRDESRAFAKLLLEASQQTECPVYVVLTMRSDYLGDCSQFGGLAEAVNHGEYLIPRLGRDELRKAIEGPVKVGGGNIANRLVQRLLNDVGDDPDQLPVLQHALMRMWDAWERDRTDGEPIDRKHYDATGGMEDALSRHADEVWESLPSDTHRKAAVSVFKSLTEKGADNRGIRRPTRLRSLALIAEADPDIVSAVIEAYRAPGVTFLMPGVGTKLSERTVIDLSHESLMRVWRRLRLWVEEEAQSARIFRRLADTAALWRERKAGLYRDPDLQIARSWREEYRPNETWAAQYAAGFSEAMVFLDQSREAIATAEREREEARQRELAQAKALAQTKERAAVNFRRFSVGVAVLAVASIILAFWALRLWKEADQSHQEAVQNFERAESNARIAAENAQRAEAEAERAGNAEAEAVELATEARHEQGTVWLERARFLLEEKKHLGAKLLAARAVGFEGYGRETQDASFKEAYPVLLRRASDEARAVDRLIRTEPDYPTIWRSPVSMTPSDINAVAYGPDGSKVAVGGDAGDVHVWDVSSGERMRVFWQGFPVTDLAFATDGLSLVSGSADGTVRVWNVESGEETLRIVVDAAVVALAVSNDGKRIALGVGGDVRFYSLTDGQEVPPRLEKYESLIYDLAFHPTAPLLAAGDSFGRLLLWNVQSGDLLAELTDHTRTIRALAFSPNGSHLASGGLDRTVRIWQLQGGSPQAVATWRDFGSRIWAIDFHPAKPLVAVALYNGDIDLRRFPGGELAGKFEGHHEVARIAFSPDGSQLLSGGQARTVRLWNVDSRKERTSHSKGHTSAIWGVDISPDGRLVATAAGDRTVRFWDLRSGTELFRDTGRGGQRGVLFSPDGRFAAVLASNSLRILDTAEGQVQKTLPSGPATDFALAPDGRTIATSHADGRVRLWSLESGSEIAALADSAGSVSGVAVTAIAFSPDGGRVVGGSNDAKLHVWDIEKRRHLFETRAPGSTPILTLDYSPDGSKVATAGVSTAVQIWDVTQEPPKVVQTLDAGRDSRPIRCLAFSPDGTLLASGGNDSTVRIWDLNAGTLLATLEGHKRPVTSVRFAPDSRSLVSAGLDKTVRLWEIQPPRVSTIADPENYFAAFRFSPDGEAVLTGGRGRMQLIDRRTRSDRRSFPVQEQRVISVAYAPDGKWVAGLAVGPGWKVYLWDAESEEPSASFEGTTRANVGMDFSPDSRLFAAPLGTQIHLWSVEENRELPRIVRPVDSWSVAFGPDNLLVSGESDGSVTAINVESRELFRIKAFDRQLTRVAVSGDGRLVAAGGIDGVVRVFELASRNLLHEFREHSGFVCVDFSPDASFLASVGTGDQTLRLWDMEEGQEQAVFKGQSSEVFFDVDFSSDGSLVGTSDFGSQLHIWDARSRVGDVSRFADYLKHLEIQGRHVDSRTVDNLYEEEGIPLRPVSQGTHIALLRRGGTDEEIQRALFWHVLRAQNLRGAAQILRHLSAEETPSERDALSRELVRAAREATGRGLAQVALAWLDVAQEFAPKLPGIVAVRARALVGAKRADEAFAIMGEAIRELQTSRGDAAADRVFALAEERLRLRLETGDHDAARDDLGVLLALPELADHEARDRVLEEYSQALVTALLSTPADDSKANQRLLAFSLGALFGMAQRTEDVDFTQAPFLNQLIRRVENDRPPTMLVRRGAVWRFRDETDAPATDWRAPEFDDSGWRSGPSPLGFGDGREATSLRSGQMAYYARYRFSIDAVAWRRSTGARLRLVLDDGVVVYLNGQEIHRDNMPGGAIRHSTRAVLAVSGTAEGREDEANPDISHLLRAGENVLAVEIHQAGASSSDLHFEMELVLATTPVSFVASLDSKARQTAIELTAELVPESLYNEVYPQMRFAYADVIDSADPLAKDPRAWRTRSRLQRALGRHDEALKTLERALALIDPQERPADASLYDSVHLELTRRLRGLGRDDEAQGSERAWVARELKLSQAVRINCGGDHFTAPDGIEWWIDRFFNRGWLHAEGAGGEYTLDIAETDNDPIYQTGRFFRPGPIVPVYRIPVPNGRYRVRLHFAEIYFRLPDQRIFDVKLEDEVVLADYDPVAAVGPAKPDVVKFEVEVKDDWLDIEFVHKINNPMIAAIEIERLE